MNSEWEMLDDLVYCQTHQSLQEASCAKCANQTGKGVDAKVYEIKQLEDWWERKVEWERYAYSENDKIAKKWAKRDGLNE